MRKFGAIAAVPLFLAAGAASAAQPVALDDGQMDSLTAGFASAAQAFADGRGAIVNTVATTVTELANVARGTINKVNPALNESIPGEASLTLVRSTANAASGTYTLPYTRIAVPF
jgi:hypothetical protein